MERAVAAGPAERERRMPARATYLDASHFCRVIAVSDIHGCDTAFDALLTKVAFSDGDALVLLGDYAERGTQALPLVRRIMALALRGNTFPLMGNCDNVVEELFQPRFRGDMLRYLTRHPHTVLHEMLCEQGMPFSAETPPSPSLDDVRAVVQAHYGPERAFLAGLPHILYTDTHVFVHAGLDAGLPLTAQDDDRCLKRKDFFATAPAFEKTLVVGHMPGQFLTDPPSGDVLFDAARNLISIDGGATAAAPAQLNALVIENGAYRTVSVPVDEAPSR